MYVCVYVRMQVRIAPAQQDMKSGTGLETWADGSTFKGEYRPCPDGPNRVFLSESP